MIKASIYCAFTVTSVFFLVGFLRNSSSTEIDMNFLVAVLMGGGFLWVIGFGLCVTLLLPLLPIFQRTSLACSFLLFTIIGFYIPAYLSYFISTIPAHGETPAIYKEDNTQAILSILYAGLVGAAGAASAWYSLKRDTVKNA